ncbi:hypothetical protein [Reichenbachiella ulvae]|uniref:Uncharacterized protein n=1 Tax=Reichenbachiella ulvae TaxID=2980104 RepID=A0ABT3D0S5_9BACT|nr:hypothetical protein [Reichenbachiella ulvae]MCV9389553.1 hypothetical protein [Reichenbachiella ulvae]
MDNFHTNFAFKSPSENDSTQFELIESTFEKKVIQVQDYAEDTARSRPEWLSFYFDSEKGNAKNMAVKFTEESSDEHNVSIFIKEDEMDSIITNNLEYQKRLKANC